MNHGARSGSKWRYLEKSNLMSIYNKQFYDKITKNSINISFLELSDEFCRLKNEFESAMVNKPSVFEQLRVQLQFIFLLLLISKAKSVNESANEQRRLGFGKTSFSPHQMHP